MRVCEGAMLSQRYVRSRKQHPPARQRQAVPRAPAQRAELAIRTVRKEPGSPSNGLTIGARVPQNAGRAPVVARLPGLHAVAAWDVHTRHVGADCGSAWGEAVTAATVSHSRDNKTLASCRACQLTLLRSISNPFSF